MDKSTEDLQSELTKAKSFDEFCRRNNTELQFPSAADYLNYLLQSKNISKVALIANSNLERTYVYHILSGSKTPGRNKLIIFFFCDYIAIMGLMSWIGHYFSKLLMRLVKSRCDRNDHI